MVKYTRKEILERFRQTVSERKPIIGAGVGAGITARCAETANADLIIASPAERDRITGTPVSPRYKLMNITALYTGIEYNAILLNLIRELQRVVEKTPIIAAVDSSDLKRRMADMLKELATLESCGIINFPSVDIFPSFARKYMEFRKLGFPREVELIRLAHNMEFFTMGYTCSTEGIRQMAKAGADAIVVGLDGAQGAKTLTEAAKKLQEAIEVGKKVNSDINVLFHGGPISAPEDTQYLYDHTNTVGFIAGMDTKTIPLEKALEDCIRDFKSKILARLHYVTR